MLTNEERVPIIIFMQLVVSNLTENGEYKYEKIS